MAEGSASPIEITFPDGSHRSVAPGRSAGELLGEWKPDAVSKALAARLDLELIDLERPVQRSGKLSPVTFEDRAGREILHHSAAHVVAKAVMEAIPDARPTVGPATEQDFHYDFDVRPLTPEDLDRVRSIARRIVEADEPFHREELSREAALDLFRANPHKQEYIQRSDEGAVVSIYRTGTWTDLCRGPHVPSTHWLRGLHLLGFSGVTKGGVPDGLPLQRIRGVAFPTQQEREAFLKMRKEAEARDHRVLGAQLELFHFIEEAPGFPFWLPKGMIILRELERFEGEHLRAAGYSEIRTPLMFSASIFQTSGHWEHYRENMFLTSVDDRPYGVKPMNCPGAILVFKSRSRSYRELPLRLAEWAPIHRLEPSGTIHGLTRVREFIQDDAHIFLTEDQIEGEVRILLNWVQQACSTLQLNARYELSTRPEKFMGEVADWDRAEAVLERVLQSTGTNYRVNPGDGAFYGPKIDIHIRDSLGRSWQTGTIQVDYQQPIRFDLNFQGADGVLHRPIIVHRTILGSFERFTGVLLEHCGGRLPPWLAPVQIRILPVAERHLEAARALEQELKAEGIRAESTEAGDTLSKRVRAAEVEKIPYIAVLGDQEVETHLVTLRVHGDKVPRKLGRPDLSTLLLDRIQSRSFDP
jgi:threonyl-tRNA synthetase